MRVKQRTINVTVSAKGTGLHSGEMVSITLLPAPVDHGIVFKRLDAGGKKVTAHSIFVNEVKLATTLEQNGVKVVTVEHLLSAFSAMGIDNVLVELNSFEVPIMDGSAEPFAFLVQAAGIVEQNADKQFFVIKEPVEVTSGDCWARVVPYHGFQVSAEIDFDHPAIKASGQKLCFDFTNESYAKEISRARTFGFMKNLEFYHKEGYVKGAGLNNAIALDDHRILNGQGLRYRNEFIKHKILDVIGDLYLLGGNIIGRFEGYKIGHHLNDKLRSKILQTRSAWDFQSFDEEDVPIIF